MPHFFQTKILSFILACALIATTFSCKKKDEAPVDLSGTLDATFSPAGSILAISLSPQGSASSVAGGNPDATGYLKLNGLSEGNYVVTFSPTSGYTAPAPQNVTITAKANTALGTIRVDKAPPLNTPVSYPLQGTSGWASNLLDPGIMTTATNAASSGSVTFYNGTPTSLVINAIYQSGSTAETVQLTTNYAGVGQYSLGNVTGAGLGSYVRTSGGATTYTFDTKVSGVQGTLTVTAHDLAKHTITGTFGFNGYNSRGVKGVVVSNGTFSLSY